MSHWHQHLVATTCSTHFQGHGAFCSFPRITAFLVSYSLSSIYCWCSSREIDILLASRGIRCCGEHVNLSNAGILHPMYPRNCRLLHTTQRLPPRNYLPRCQKSRLYQIRTHRPRTYLRCICRSRHRRCSHEAVRTVLQFLLHCPVSQWL